jgi:flagellar hook assembly protein FlgD
VIDVTGRTVQVLHDGTANSGVTNVDWDGRDTSGNRVASGVYFFRLDSNDRSTTIKGTLLR